MTKVPFAHGVSVDFKNLPNDYEEQTDFSLLNEPYAFCAISRTFVRFCSR